MSKPDGGPAFPTDQTEYMHEKSCVSGGMTLRDWFAGQVTAGLCVGCAGFIGSEFSAYAKGHCNAALAERAYVLADAMLAERVK